VHEPQVQNFVGKKSNVQSSLANLAAALEERKSPCFGFDKEMKGTAQTHGYITFNRFLSEAASLLGKEAMVNLKVWESSCCRVCSPFFEAADLLGPKPESEQVAPAMSSPAKSAGAAGSLPSAMCKNTVRTVRSSRFLPREVSLDLNSAARVAEQAPNATAQDITRLTTSILHKMISVQK